MVGLASHNIDMVPVIRQRCLWNPTNRRSRLEFTMITSQDKVGSMPALLDHTSVKNFIISNDLYLLPLQSIKGGICTCRKQDCCSPGKHPLLPYSWKRIATNDETRINGWLAKSDINYGIATGRKSKINGMHLFVIDVDTPNHEILAKLPKTTFHYRTGSGGWHFWFWSQYAIPNSTSKIAPRVDIRGVGGYVVIPPSRHISGSSYVADFKTDIQIADKSILDIIFSKAKKDTSIKISRKEQNNNSVLPDVSGKIGSKEEMFDQIQAWSRTNIGEIRSWLFDGKKIPAGIRNVLLHRLLSSDRAKGFNKKQLMNSAQEYRNCCEKGESIFNRELTTLVNQVSKYPTYNSSYEKVNDHYFDVMKRVGKPIDLEEQMIIRDLDQRFFSSLIKTDKNEGSPIIALINDRDKLIENSVSRFSKYPQALFAAKLKSLGFKRYRTAKGNFWNCRVDQTETTVG